jgi:hypothetical protein
VRTRTYASHLAPMTAISWPGAAIPLTL